MLRTIGASLRHRTARAVALLLGMLVATTGFTVLTGSTQTARLQVAGTVAENARGSYDILVRPPGARTDAEQRRGLVQPNFLGGQYGGITAQQWRAIQGVAGVEAAAPVAMLGYVGSEPRWVQLDITDAVDRDAQRQLIEVRPRWLADRGLTGATDENHAGYVYLTRNRVVWPEFDHIDEDGEIDPSQVWEEPIEATYSDGIVRPAGGCGSGTQPPYEILETGEAVPICLNVESVRPHRMELPVVELTGDGRLRTHAGTTDRLLVGVQVPQPLLLVAAVDPGQEAALVGLNEAVVSGRYLADHEPARESPWAGFYSEGEEVLSAPALVAAQPPVDEQVLLEARPVEWDGAPIAGDEGRVAAELAPLPRDSVSRSAPADVAAGYREFIDTAIQQLSTGTSGARMNEDGSGYLLIDEGIQSLAGLGDRIRVGPLEIREEPDGALRPAPLPPAIESLDAVSTGDPGWRPALSPLAGDTAFRPVDPTGDEGTDLGRLLHTEPVGVFDPALLSGMEGLARVPLETYAVSQATGADVASRELLGDRPLLPAASTVGGYLTTPPSILVSLDTVLEHTTDPAPISAVRVRVAGVTGFDDLSRERVRVAAELIAAATGLEVDVVFGSSPAGQEVVLPAGDLGRPELRLAEDWSLKNVATTIVTAVDRKSVVLFGLILVVCALFLGNATAAAVRDRRRELAVLACLGWSRWRLGLVVAGEVAAIGLAAGVLAAVLAPLLGRMAGLDVPASRAWLAVPVALGLALAASVMPVWRAARSHPGAAVAPAVVAPRARGRSRRRVLGMAAGNLARVPARSALGAFALAVGVAGLTLLAAVTVTFHGTVTGSLLGDAVSVRVRGVDLVAVLGTLLLGLVAVADVLYVNIRDRAAELATLRATGWSEAALGRLVAYEGLGMGFLGSGLGCLAGVGGAWWFTGTLPAGLAVAAASVAAAGVALAALAALVPAVLQRRVSMATLLAQE